MEGTQEEGRYADTIRILGRDKFDKLRQSKVLVVGAGGIGCELLKNLVLVGFPTIEIIDLDTIDVSNLNRQFLFQSQHVGMSKAEVARESALKFNPHVNIVAYRGNIKSHDFGPDYFKQFTLVMNALDNLDARRHVNRMCLAANIPLIESGTEGYLGQVTVFKKGQTECFECLPKPAPKTYAVCTIRSNPTRPIHCIVWAKRLFNQLYSGEADDENTVTDLEEEISVQDIMKQNGGESEGEGQSEKPQVSAEELQQLEATKTQIKELLQVTKRDKGLVRWLFAKVFNTDITLLALVDKLRSSKDRRPADKTQETRAPTPLDYDAIMSAEDEPEAPSGSTLLKDQILWTLKETARQFVDSAERLDARRQGGTVNIGWDKDDADALDFVTAATSLRCHIFGIPRQTRFDVKAAAGNIIPAIASTNAIISGLIVMEALKVIEGNISECRSSFLLRKPSRGRFLLPARLEQPNPDCYVCSSNWVQLSIDTESTKLRYFVDEVLKTHLGLIAPSIITDFDIIYEEGEDAPDMSKQLEKTLSQVRLVHNSVVKVEDFRQDLEVEISITHKTDWPADKKPYEVLGRAAATHHSSRPTQIAAEKEAEDKRKQQEEEEDDLVVLDGPLPTTAASQGVKRKRQDGSEGKGKDKEEEESNGMHDEKEEEQQPQATKRRRTEPEAPKKEDEDVIVLD